MDIALRTDTWTWAHICGCLQSFAPLCRAAPHFIWFVGPVPRYPARDLALLVRQLDLEDHFAEVDSSEPELPPSAFQFRNQGPATDWRGQLERAASYLDANP